MPTAQVGLLKSVLYRLYHMHKSRKLWSILSCHPRAIVCARKTARKVSLKLQQRTLPCPESPPGRTSTTFNLTFMGSSKPITCSNPISTCKFNYQKTRGNRWERESMLSATPIGVDTYRLHTRVSLECSVIAESSNKDCQAFKTLFTWHSKPS